MKRALAWVLLSLLALAVAVGAAGWYWWLLPRYQAQSVARHGPFRAMLASGRLLPQGPIGPLRAGMASVDISPTRPVPLGGYGARHGRPSTGVHDRIHAKALVLDNGANRVAIITMDQIGCGLSQKRAVLRRVGRMLHLSEDSLLLCASHSHSTPGANARSAAAQLAIGRYDSRVERRLEDDLCRVLTTAAGRLQPARLGCAQVPLPGFVRNRRDQDTFTDPLLTLLKIERPDGKISGLWVNYAAHGTCLPPQNMRVSGDWMGYLQRYLERALPGCVALYSNGAEGDQAPTRPRPLFARAPADPLQADFAEARDIGQGVAQAALAAARHTPATGHISLAGAALPVHLPTTPLGMLIGKSTQVQALGIGDLALVTVPGEMTAEVGAALKERVRRLGFPRVAIVGLANDHIMYVTSPRQYRAGGYEAGMTFYGPGLAALISNQCENAAMCLAVRMAQTPPVSRQGQATRCGRGVTWRQQGQRIALLQGNAWELGYQHGALLRPEVKRLEQAIPDAVTTEAGLPRPLAPAVLWASRRPSYILERYLPAEFILETYGLAHGAGMDYDRALLVQVMLAIAEQPNIKQSLGLGASCSNLVILGPTATNDSGPLYGRNLDWGMGEVLGDLATVFVYNPNVGNRFVVAGWAGVAGCLTAMNHRGLCIGEESVSSPRDCSLQGQPLFVLIRQAIQHCDTLEQAKRLIIRTPGTCGYHITLLEGGPMNSREGYAASGEALTIERTAHYWAVRRPREGVLSGCIDVRLPAEYEGGRLPHPAISRADGSSDHRYHRLRDLAAQYRGRVDEAVMMRMMSDPVDPDTGQPAAGMNSPCNVNTLHSVVWKPSEGAFWVAQGQVPAPRGGYARFTLADLLAGPPAPAEVGPSHVRAVAPPAN